MSSILNITLEPIGNQEFYFFIHDVYPDWGELGKIEFRLKKSKKPDLFLKQYAFGILIDYMDFQNIEKSKSFYHKYTKLSYLESSEDYNEEDGYQIPDSNPNEPESIVNHFIDSTTIVDKYPSYFYKNRNGEEKQCTAIKLYVKVNHKILQIL